MTDITACPSNIDVAPQVILESLAAGKPVIASKIDSIPEMIDDGKNGILIEPNDQAGLQSAIERMLDNYQSFKHGAEAALPDLQKRYSIERTARAFAGLIEKTKLRKKKYSVELKGGEIKFTAKQDTILRFKKLVPAVGRKASSAFR